MWFFSGLARVSTLTEQAISGPGSHLYYIILECTGYPFFIYIWQSFTHTVLAEFKGSIEQTLQHLQQQQIWKYLTGYSPQPKKNNQNRS